MIRRTIVPLMICLAVIGFSDAAVDVASRTFDAIHLAPPLTLDDIGDNSPHQKNIALAEIALEMDLHRLDRIRDIDDVDDPALIQEAFRKCEWVATNGVDERTVFSPARIKAYFDHVDHIAGHVFAVRVSVEKGDAADTYQLLFSTHRNAEGMFPVVLCPDRQIEKVRRAVLARDELPVRSPVDHFSIGRYKEHERSPDPSVKSLDEWIRGKMESGDYAVSDAYYPSQVRYYGARFLYPAASQQRLVGEVVAGMKELGVNADEADRLGRILSEKPLILIYREAGEPLPTLTMQAWDGTSRRVAVRAHSSDNAVYIVLDHAEFRLMQKGALPGAFRAPIDMEGNDAIFRRIAERYFYEAGDHLGLTGIVSQDGSLGTVLTAARAQREADAAGYVPSAGIGALKVAAFGQNLRTRDYADGLELEPPARPETAPPDEAFVADARRCASQGLSIDLVSALAPLITPAEPVTLAEMINRLRNEVPRGKPRPLIRESVRGGVMIIDAGDGEIDYDLRVAKAIQFILEERGVLKEPEPASNADAMTVLASIHRAIRDRVMSPSELYATVHGIIRVFNPELSGAMDARRLAERAGAMSGPVLEGDMAEMRLPTPYKTVRPLSGMEKRFVRLAFFLPESESGWRYAVRRGEEPMPDRLIALRIEDAWKAAGVMTEEPFSDEAQACFARIIDLTADVRSYGDRFDIETWYRIVYARLFGAGDVRSAIDFYEFAMDERQRDPAWGAAIVNGRHLASLGVVARMMDRQSIEAVSGARLNAIDHYLTRLFDADLKHVARAFGEAYVDSIYQRIVMLLEKSIHGYWAREDYGRAYGVLDNLIYYLDGIRSRPEVKADPDRAKEYAGILNLYLEWRANIAKWRDAHSSAGSLRDATPGVDGISPVASLARTLAAIPIDRDDLARAMQLSDRFGMTSLREKSALVFSERVTFDAQFGAYLPTVAQAGMRVIVVAPREEQKRLIEEMNEGIDEGKRIIPVDSIDMVPSGFAKYYYCMVAGDPAPGRAGFVALDITQIVEQILRNLGKICSLSETEIKTLHEVMERFRQVSAAA